MIIDVSEYQSTINWSKVKAAPQLEGIYIKACEGVGCPDKKVHEHAIGAIGVGIPIGFYHFATLNSQDVVADATAEAHFFMNTINAHAATLPPMLDLEKNLAGINSEKVQIYISTFFSELQRAGLDHVLYSYTPFLNANLPVNHTLGQHKLWIAAYVPKPIIPRGWTSFWLWQYTQKGFVNGIAGNVDLSKRP